MSAIAQRFDPSWLALAPPWLVVAHAELGVKEIPGPAAHPRILAYKQHTTLKSTSDEVAWCSDFACFSFESVGIRSTRNAMALSWKDWGIPLEVPIVGAVLVFDHGGGKGHVTFFVGHTRARLLGGLGGNQSNSVKVSAYGPERLVAIRYPSIPIIDLAAVVGESTR